MSSSQAESLLVLAGLTWTWPHTTAPRGKKEHFPEGTVIHYCWRCRESPFTASTNIKVNYPFKSWITMRMHAHTLVPTHVQAPTCEHLNYSVPTLIDSLLNLSALLLMIHSSLLLYTQPHGSTAKKKTHNECMDTSTHIHKLSLSSWSTARTIGFPFQIVFRVIFNSHYFLQEDRDNWRCMMWLFVPLKSRSPRMCRETPRNELTINEKLISAEARSLKWRKSTSLKCTDFRSPHYTFPPYFFFKKTWQKSTQFAELQR